MSDNLAEKIFPRVVEALKKVQQPTDEERIAALEAAVADLALMSVQENG